MTGLQGAELRKAVDLTNRIYR